MPSGSVRIWEGMTEPFLKVEILYQFQLLLQICTNTFLWLHWVLTFARWSTRLGILRYSLAGLRRCPSDAVATDLGAFRGGVRSAGTSGKKSFRHGRIARLCFNLDKKIDEHRISEHSESLDSANFFIMLVWPGMAVSQNEKRTSQLWSR